MMHLRAMCYAFLGIAGLLSSNVEDVLAAENLSYSRMFPGLVPYAPPTNEARDMAQKMGVMGGPCDALDNLTDPIKSITESETFSPNNPDNPKMTAGMTFFGQFLDHDITLAMKAPLKEATEPRTTTNFRTAQLDLDSLYGDGPDQSPELYDTSSGDIKFKVDEIPGSAAVSRGGKVRFDLPRDANNNAIIGDFRNDENILISQFHLAMLMFHNAVVDRLRSDPTKANRSTKEIFTEAQREVRWHYQWIIVNEFLPLTIGQGRVNQIMHQGPRFYNLGDRSRDRDFRSPQQDPLIPVEFAVAAYRFGHSQVRPSYRMNFGASPGNEFFAFIFDDSADPNDPDPNDMRGGKRAARRFVDWQTFFDFRDGNVRNNKKIDAKLSTPLMLLPGSRGAAPGMPNDGVQSLPSRNLMRHVNFGIPSGQAIARVMGVRVLTPEQLSEMTPYNMEKNTPLWIYILKEAEILEQGLRLGPVGSRIVGEVFIGLLKADKESYLSGNRNWKPTLPSAKSGDFEIADLLKFAGVVHPLE